MYEVVASQTIDGVGGGIAPDCVVTAAGGAGDLGEGGGSSESDAESEKKARD
ncbi:MAG: hypothetical protein GDA55_05980 [Cellvibrionales bacterium]|nr:hypothetical protein [Cellvibrionales bacterium]